MCACKCIFVRVWVGMDVYNHKYHFDSQATLTVHNITINLCSQHKVMLTIYLVLQLLVCIVMPQMT